MISTIRKNRYVVCAIISFALITFYLLWRVRFGCAGGDEGLYLSVPYRILQGDLFFKDEWIYLQLGELFLVPILKIYLLLFKSTDNIFLHFRYIYIFYQLLITILIYLRFKKYNFFAIIGASFYYIFVPTNIFMLSYNTFGYSMMFSAFLIIYPFEKFNFINYFLSGICFANACLCQVSILFFVVPVFIIVFFLLLKFNKRMIRYLIYFIFGCIFSALLVIIYLQNTTGLVNVFKNLHYCLEIDSLFHNSSHSLLYFFYKNACDYFGYNFKNHTFFMIFILLYAMYFIGLYLFVRYKCYLNNKYRHLSNISILFVLISLFVVLYSFCHVNFVLVPFIIALPFLYCFLDNNEKKSIIISLCFSLIEVFGFYHSENYGAVTSFAIVPTCIVIIIYLYNFLKLKINVVSKSIYACFTITFISLFLTRTIKVYASTSILNLKKSFDEGIFKGLYTDSETYSKYNNFINEINSLNLTDSDNILFLNDYNYSWMPLCTNARLSQYSPFLFYETDKILGLLVKYYNVRPSKSPDYVYITDIVLEDKEDVKNKFLDIIDNNFKLLSSSDNSIILVKGR